MKKKWPTVLAVLGVILSLSVIAYYPIMEWVDSKKREEIISHLDLQNKGQDETKKTEMLKQAHAYNEVLGRLDPEIPPDQILPYEKQLVSSSEEAPFAWIRIPKISLEMPVYHSTEHSVLAQGVGHLSSSSLPVGGPSTHAVLSAHSGMPNERAFDDIRELEVGDYFGVNVLNDWYGYRVSSIDTVLPYDMESLDIQPGQDMMTLVTCTPYGINDHRLLVHAVRSELPENFFTQKATVAQTVTNRRVWPFLLGAGAVLLTVLVLLIRRHRKKKVQKNAKN